MDIKILKNSGDRINIWVFKLTKVVGLCSTNNMALNLIIFLKSFLIGDILPPVLIFTYFCPLQNFLDKFLILSQVFQNHCYLFLLKHLL